VKMGISKISRTALIVSVAFVFGLVNMSSALAQKRTLAELKVEVQTRADHNTYPLAGLSPGEVREALERLTTLDPNEWAASWSFLGDRYMAKAQGELPSSAAQADKDFIRAWRYYTIGRYPVPDSPGKEKAYEKALEAFLAHGRLLDPPLEIVHIPFEGKEIIGYVQMPKGAKLAPMIVAIGGLDSRKEDMAEMFRSGLASGVGYLALDPPGAGQAPIKASPGAERMLMRAFDYAFQRPDVDKGRVAIYGSSLGGYWVTILAATEYNRARAVVALSPPVHYTFQRERTMAVPTNREYLMDYLEAQLFTYEGATDIETLAQVREKMSLKTRGGILDAPMAPMLVIGGALDTQVPVSDVELLLVSGQTPKEFWINPQGRHTGRDSKEWSDGRVFETVTVPWILRMLGVKTD
jgi:esterase FrsA